MEVCQNKSVSKNVFPSIVSINRFEIQWIDRMNKHTYIQNSLIGKWKQHHWDLCFIVIASGGVVIVVAVAYFYANKINRLVVFRQYKGIE